MVWTNQLFNSKSVYLNIKVRKKNAYTYAEKIRVNFS